MALQPSRICILLAAMAAPLAAAQVSSSLDRVVLHGNIPAAVALAEPVGRPDPAVPMERMILSLRIAPAAQAGLDALLSQQQDPKSPLYHHWLTPEAFGAQFGPAQQDLDAVLAWLKENDFQVEEVGPGRTTVVFSGDVQRVEQAFQTLILDYRLNGQNFHANAIAPSLPASLANVVHGVVSLHNLPRKAMNRGFAPVASAARPLYTAGGATHYLAPGDFASIYNVNPLYTAGTDGTGVSIAIVGRTHIAPADITAFRSQFGLPANAPQFIVNGADPGDLGAGEDGEADLDVEWAGAVARNATIKFVMSKSTGSTDGVDLSAQYIVDNNLAPVMSTSFGQCEGYMGASENNFYANLWAQAAAQGITAFVAAGDSGAAGCSDGSASSGSGQGVSGLASTPSNVCVGGTEFNEAGGSYWAASNGAGGASALGYIPEKAWNESGSVAGGSGLWATGGGASSLYAKPAWQAAPGVPGDGRRDVPDVALSAGGHDGYLIQSQGSLQAAGGTSCASPAFAGIMALVVQKTGQRQGNANPVLYQLGNAQYKGAGPAVFHDTLTGGNGVPGATGYLCGPGYDQATGLGSVDAQALVGNWSKALANKVTAAIAAPAANETVASGASVSFSGSASDSSATAALSYSWSFGDGASATGAAPSHSFSNTGSASAAYTVTLTATDSTGAAATATRVITVTPVPRNTLTASVTTPAASETVASGAAVSFSGSAKDSSSTATLSYSWNFGDGASAAGTSASHGYINTGTTSAVYTVTLTAKDNTGVTATATRIITVTPAPRNTLSASVTSPAASLTAASGAGVSFAGSAKDSSATAAISYSWTFGDGASATGASASHSYTNSGTANASFTVTLTATDNTGVTATATRAITVTPAPRNTLTASITAPAASVTVANAAAVAFTGSAKDSSASAAISYTWTFGDGASATGASASHSYSNTGTATATYTVTLTAKDSTGVTATATRAVTVTPRNTLTASVTAPAASVTVASGAAVTFAGSAKDSSATAAVSYSWNFGDGTSAAGALASHSYLNPGTASAVYTVTLTATDSTGVTATATRSVTVAPAPNILTAVISSPAANITVASGTTVYMTGTATDTRANPGLSYGWSASVPVVSYTGPHALVNPTTLNSVCSAYFSNTGPRPYSVTFTFAVTDSTGAKASASRTITVSPAGH